jgi:hypothetical protein
MLKFAVPLALLLSLSAAATPPEAPILLPGQDEFVFTMYSCPGDLKGLQELVGVMQAQKLGNGFDPGPPSGAAASASFDFLATLGWPVVAYPAAPDMQVIDGTNILTDEDEAMFQRFDAGGAFSAIQLGEWGYYFHNLSWDETYWRGLYGASFDEHKHRMKPKGLFGYDTRPASKREAYEVLRNYFLTRNRAMRGRNLSVTGHSHYEAYAAEWGTRLIGLEVGENIAFAQSKFAFARGASRQWGIPWSAQVSPWLSGAVTMAGPLRLEGNNARGIDAGHSLSFYTRMWLHGWFAGAAMVTPENSIAIFFEPGEPAWRLTSHGERARDVFAFMRNHDRGTPWTPIAIVLDQYAGYNGFMAKPWGILEPTQGDNEITDLLEEQLFPGSDHFRGPTDKSNPEASFLRPTPYGESFDVLLSTARAKTLEEYPAILLAGDHEFDDLFVTSLFEVVRAGSTLLLHPHHAEALGEDLARLQGTGKVEILDVWTNPDTGRPAAIAQERLAALVAAYVPIAVSGDPIEYQINRNGVGWVIELINNAGVIKTRDQPAIVEQDKVARVKLLPKFTFTEARQWTAGDSTVIDTAQDIVVPPGETVFVEFTLAP